MTDKTKAFDIEKILRDKSPDIAKWVPNFIIRFLRKIGHEKEANEIIRDYGHLQGFDFSKAIIKKFNINIKTEGLENLPDTGKFIFVSNHPLGGFDGHILMYLVGLKYGTLNYRFLVNDILMTLKNLRCVFLPINKHGRQGAEGAKKIDEAYNSDVQMMTFPAGLVSRKINGQIVDLPWQKNFIVKAKQHQRHVIPIHMSGGNTKFFYRLGNIRKKLGIKLNIEMLYLIDETFNQKGNEFVVKFGNPIPWETFDTTKRPAEWAKWVKEKTYKLDGVDNIPF